MAFLVVITILSCNSKNSSISDEHELVTKSDATLIHRDTFQPLYEDRIGERKILRLNDTTLLQIDSVWQRMSDEDIKKYTALKWSTIQVTYRTK